MLEFDILDIILDISLLFGFFLWLVINTTILNAIYDYFSKIISFLLLIFFNIFFINIWLLYLYIYNIMVIPALCIVIWTYLVIEIDNKHISIFVRTEEVEGIEEVDIEEINNDEELLKWYYQNV